MKKVLRILKTGLTCYCLLLSSNLSAQLQSAWAHAIGGGKDNFTHSLGQATAIDSLGNVYVIGYLGEGDVADFDPGTGTANWTSSGRNGDCFIAKYDPDGTFLWVKPLSSNGNLKNGIYLSSIVSDPSGNIYIGGTLNGDVVFDPNSANLNLSAIGAHANAAILIKMNASGSLIWFKQFASSGGVTDASAVTIDKSGYVYCAGSYRFSMNIEGTTLTANALNDVYVSKFDTSGSMIWAKSMGGNGDDEIRDIAIDRWGNVYTTGKYRGMADFDPGPNTAYLIVPGSVSSAKSFIFISKLDSSGNYVWAKDFVGSYDGLVTAIDVDEWGNVYTTGRLGTSPPTDFDPGPGEVLLFSSAPSWGMFVSKLDSAGNYLWAKKTESSAMVQGASLSLDEYSNIYLYGDFYGSTDFDPDTSSTHILNSATGSIFVQKLDAAGKLIWAKNMGPTATSPSVFNCISLGRMGEIYVTGGFSGKEISFDPGGSGGVLLSTAGTGSFRGLGIFIQKLVCPVGKETISVTECSDYSFYGETLNQSGIYTHLIPNVAGGCDSVIELVLTIPVLDAELTENNGTLTTDIAEANYQWVDCNTNISINGETGQSFTPTTDGKYAVIVTLDGCSDTSDCIDFKVEKDITSIRELGAGNAIVLYPNPAEGQVHLKTNRNIQNATVTLFNITGQQVMQKKDLQGTRFSFDISPYPGGVYFIEVREQANAVRMKFTIN